MLRFVLDGSQEWLWNATNGEVLKRPVNFSKPTEPMVRNSWTLLSLGTRPGSVIWHQKWKNNPVTWNIQSFRSCASSNKRCPSAKWWQTFFWDRKELLACKFSPAGIAIDADRYCHTWQKLRHAIQNKRRGIRRKRVHLHQGNARPHTVNVTIDRFGWDIVTHPPYGPDIAPRNYHFFPEMNKHLGGTCFVIEQKLKEEV